MSNNATPEANVKPKSIGEQLSEALTNWKAAVSEKAVLIKERDEALSAHATAQKRVEELEASAKTSATTITTLTKERDDARAESTKLKGEAKTVSDAVIETVSTIGLPAVQTPKAEDKPHETNAANHKGKYDELLAAGKYAEAGAFFAKNREKILT